MKNVPNVCGHEKTFYLCRAVGKLHNKSFQLDKGNLVVIGKKD